MSLSGNHQEIAHYYFYKMENFNESDCIRMLILMSESIHMNTLSDSFLQFMSANRDNLIVD
tara:strand:- start:20221 stop:20403 length:183 start_codon:yes stop_codon:yes gene_type:complete